MCCEAALYVCAVPEYLEIAMRDYMAILRDFTRCYAMLRDVTRHYALCAPYPSSTSPAEDCPASAD